MTLLARRPVPCLCLLALLAAACSGGDPDKDAFRGKGLHAASVDASSRAGAYEAAIRAAFDLGDPAVSVLLDTRVLPRTEGLDSAGTLPDSVTRILMRRGAVRGTCRPPIGKKGTPRCEAALPGYVVRFSDVLAVSGDTAEVYMWVAKYDNAASGSSRPLRFQRAYQLVHRGAGAAQSWRAEQEARIPES
jgi:hypothetical protein